MSIRRKNKRILITVAATLLASVLLSFIAYKQLALLHFINISFYFSSAYIMAGLLILVVDKGFFDGMSYSFRRLFKRNSSSEAGEDVNDIVPLSQLVNLPYSSLLISGFILLGIMLISLMVFYL
ncbi:DUF3899 domain-containing protein [Bacillus sp. 1P06AnD]|uniref:DUF3899 domain-containing protein n=1 Tax=Bacillus sp. 1P06AnD TaxID=3132208 RepID=UPI0039A35C91